MKIEYDDDFIPTKRPITISLTTDEAQILANLVMTVEWESLPDDLANYLAELSEELTNYGYDGSALDGANLY